MPLNNWDETVANGRRRVFRIEIDRPLSGTTIARFHLERVFVDGNDQPIASSQAGSWQLPLAVALADPELSVIVEPLVMGLEALSQRLYEREQAELARADAGSQGA